MCYIPIEYLFISKPYAHVVCIGQRILYIHFWIIVVQYAISKDVKSLKLKWKKIY